MSLTVFRCPLFLFLLLLGSISQAADGYVLTNGKRQMLALDPSPLSSSPVFLESARPFVIGRIELNARATAMARSDDTLWLVSGSHLQWFSVTTPWNEATLTRPGLPGLELPAAVNQLVLVGHLALLTGGAGLYIVDISTRDAPRLRGHLSLDKSVRAMSADDGRVYLLMADNQVQIVDMRDPDTPRTLSDVPLSGIARALRVHDGLLFVAVAHSGLAIFDVQDPEKPRHLGQARATCSGSDLALSGKRVYLACGAMGVAVFDVHDPSQPVWLGSHQQVGDVRQVRVLGDHLYVVSGQGQLSLLDVNHPDMPSMISTRRLARLPTDFMPLADRVWVLSGRELLSIDLVVHPPQLGNDGLDFGQGVNLGGQRRAAIRGDYMYVADWFSGIHIYDISRPGQLHLVASLHTPGSPKGIVLKGDLAYVADDDHGLEVIDIHDPHRPEIVTRLPTEGLAYTPVIDGDRLYLASHRGGFQIIDISLPRKPRILSRYDTPGKAWSIRVQGHYAYVADDDNGLLVFDVSDPKKPLQIGQFSPGGAAEELLIEGGIAYVAFFDRGLFVLDISNPADIRQLAQLDLPGNARGLERVGDRLYVACWLAGVQVVDISTPNHPMHLNGYDTRGAAWGVSVVDGRAYVLDWWGGITVLDLAEPGRIRRLGTYPPHAKVQASAMSGDYVYVANGAAGLQVFDIRNPLNPTWVTGVDMRHARQIIVNGTLAYVLDGPHRVIVVDISRPFSVRMLRQYVVDVDVRLMRWRQGRLFLLGQEGRLTLLNPVDGARTHLNGPHDIIDIDLESGALAILSRSQGVLIYRLSQSGIPEQIRIYPQARGADLIRMVDGRAFVHRPGIGLVALASTTAGNTQGEDALIRLPLAVRDVQGQLGRIFALLVDGQVLQIDGMGTPWRPVMSYRSRDAATAMTLYRDVLYLSGSSGLVAIRTLPGLAVHSQNEPSQGESLSFSLPADMPVGDYQFRAFPAQITAGKASDVVADLRVKHPPYGKAKFSKDTLRRLVADRLRKNRQAHVVHP